MNVNLQVWVRRLSHKTPEGKYLCGVLKESPQSFLIVVTKQLDELATNRVGAFARSEKSAKSSESCLRKRISELKELEYKIAMEEVMYFLVVHSFYPKFP